MDGRLCHGIGQSKEVGGSVKVLCTGGGGFIGSALRRRAEAWGFDLEIFDRTNGFDLLHDEIPAADAVIHLAGVLGTAELFDTIDMAIDVNIKGTVRVLDACRDKGMSFTGITMPQVFPSVYTATKVCSTRLASAYHLAYGVKVSHVRAFNAFGPGQKHGPHHPRKIVPAFATDAWAGRPLTIWGDGEQTVDLVHIDDLARMLLDATKHGDDVTFDGGTGQAFTVNQVADLVLTLTGSKGGVEHLPMRRGEVATQIVATGEGWDRLDVVPQFRFGDFAATVDSYDPASKTLAA